MPSKWGILIICFYFQILIVLSLWKMTVVHFSTTLQRAILRTPPPFTSIDFPGFSVKDFTTAIAKNRCFHTILYGRNSIFYSCNSIFYGFTRSCLIPGIEPRLLLYAAVTPIPTESNRSCTRAGGVLPLHQIKQCPGWESNPQTVGSRPTRFACLRTRTYF